MSMSEQEQSQLKTVISARIKLLEKQLADSDAHPDRSERQGDDQDADLDITINSAVASKVRSSAKAELNRLKHQLDWLDSEDAGYCDECGCEIPFARLKASLATRMCVSCAEKWENEPNGFS